MENNMENTMETTTEANPMALEKSWAWEMEPGDRIALLERRLQILNAREKDNQGVCRRIARDIRNLKKKLES